MCLVKYGRLVSLTRPLLVQQTLSPPAIFDSLVDRQHLTPHIAWRVAFVVPFLLIAVTALVIIVACPDCPTGQWSSRAYDTQRQAEHRDVQNIREHIQQPELNFGLR